MPRKIKVKTKFGRNDVIPKKKKRLLAIINKENKGCFWKWVHYSADRFTVDRNTYFVLPEGIYLSKNGVPYSVYLEGISTPLTHKNIQKEQVNRKITTFEKGKEVIKTVKIYLIKGLKYDSKIIDMILNRGLADEFTKQHIDTPMLILLILLLTTNILGVVNIALMYYIGSGGSF